MSSPQKTPASTTAMTAPDPNGVLDAILDKAIEYIPFLAEQQILLTPRMVLRFMCKPTKSGKRATMEQALHFCMLCKARGLNPWEGDAYLVGYDTQNGPEFSLITAHQAFLKRAEVHPEYDGMQSGVIVQRGSEILEEEGDFFIDGDVLLGGWAKILFKTRSTPVYKRLKLSTFNKGFGRWNVDPAGMIVKCAEADGLRSAFPNSLGGMYLEDEMPGSRESAGEEADFTYQNGDDANKIRAPRRKSEIIAAESIAIDVNTVDAPCGPIDEKEAKKLLRESITAKIKDLSWSEKQADKFFGNRDLLALNLQELTEFDKSLDEIKRGE